MVAKGIGSMSVIVMLASGASAVVLRAKERRDGTLSGAIKVRELCRAKEIPLSAEDLGLCCAATTTTATSTLGIPDCQPGACPDGQACLEVSVPSGCASIGCVCQ
jgi:hypothetical protein